MPGTCADKDVTSEEPEGPEPNLEDLPEAFAFSISDSRVANLIAASVVSQDQDQKST